ncbi:MAG: DUF520 family protein, partial [Pseudomonadota bacterium]
MLNGHSNRCPSFDVVSQLDHHEIANAVDQANREVTTRFDFKNSGSKFELNPAHIVMHSSSDFQLQQMLDILYAKLAKRGIDLAAADPGEPVQTGQTLSQV